MILFTGLDLHAGQQTLVPRQSKAVHNDAAETLYCKREWNFQVRISSTLRNLEMAEIQRRVECSIIEPFDPVCQLPLAFFSGVGDVV